VNRALIIAGKAPQPGTTKTRLSPPLSLAQAADLDRTFLQDTAAMALGLSCESVTLIYPSQSGARDDLAAASPADRRIRSQPGRGLGAALAGVFTHHLAAGPARVVLVGSDNRTVPAAIFERAWDGLDDHDLVLGPSLDGGYHLVGMTRPHVGIFERITWSTEVVYRETLDRARTLGLGVLSLPEWYDVDTVRELRRLADDLRVLPSDTAPATRAVLGELSW
jgi:hypothetical protein